MKGLAAAFVLIVLAAGSQVHAGVGSKKTMYVAGSISSVPEETEGESSTKDDKVFTFDYKGGRLTIPYDKVTSLVYGQTTGRRIMSPVVVFNKKRKHYLTINFRDENGKEQGAVFELGKDIIQTTLAALESRTGRKIEYIGAEARKSAGLT